MTARIYQPTTTTIRRLATVLKRGGLVAVPSETVYGLAAHALDAAACQKISRSRNILQPIPSSCMCTAWRRRRRWPN